MLSAAEILELQQLVREVPVSDHIIRYTTSLVRQTRVGKEGTPDFVSDQVSWGAGPRAVQFLIVGAKARALLTGRTHVSTDDIASLAKPVLRHRMALNFAARAEGVTMAHILDSLAALQPKTLACMHGSSFSGDGAQALRDFGEVLERLNGVSGK